LERNSDDYGKDVIILKDEAVL